MTDTSVFRRRTAFAVATQMPTTLTKVINIQAPKATAMTTRIVPLRSCILPLVADAAKVDTFRISISIEFVLL